MGTQKPKKMELYGRSMWRNGSQTDHIRQPGWIQLGQETGLQGSKKMRLGFYPQRPGKADCAHYMRTGTCGYGNKCIYNHPPNCSIAAAGKGAYPEKPGEPSCQYYLRTGMCKFGASCKFHHPKHAGGSLTNVLNTYGHPLRPDEKECSYYLKTGQCKFGITCKFHHPQPTGESVPPAVSARLFYSTVQSPSPGAYGPILLSPGMVPLPNWSPYSGRVYGTNTSRLQNISQTKRVFPERPGQPECKYYMKTGECKFGACCIFHHPPDWAIRIDNCLLSPIGLPLRMGVEPCKFYIQNGCCKFGRACKFDHPVPGSFSYGPRPSNLPMAPYMTMAPSGLYSEWSKMETRSSSSSVGLMFPRVQTGSTGYVQLSSQSQSQSYSETR